MNSLLCDPQYRRDVCQTLLCVVLDCNALWEKYSFVRITENRAKGKSLEICCLLCFNWHVSITLKSLKYPIILKTNLQRILRIVLHQRLNDKYSLSYEQRRVQGLIKFQIMYKFKIMFQRTKCGKMILPFDIITYQSKIAIVPPISVQCHQR